MPRKKKTEQNQETQPVQETTPVVVEPVQEIIPRQTASVITPEDVLANKKFSQSNVDDMRESLNIFLVAQARRELERVISLSKALDKMQERYEQKALEYMALNDDDTALEYLPQMIEQLSRCLERSYTLIKDVVNNEKIMNFSIIQNNISDSEIQISSPINAGDLSDPKSRERVRRAVSEILASLPNENQIVEQPKEESGGE